MPTPTQNETDQSPLATRTGEQALTIRPTTGPDGAAMWRLARDSGALDLNPSYTYLLLARDLSATCRVAVDGGTVVGFVLAYRPPERPGRLFVWQVAVSPDVRGRGVAARLIEDLLDGHPDVDVLEATVAEGNHASRALFEGIARRRGAQPTWRPWIRAEEFPDGHEAEPLVEISPLARH